jgi:hypothetical protein
MPAIFSSYRRADSRQMTIRLRRWLLDHGIPEHEIFFDSDSHSIPPRAAFPNAIKQALSSARVVLVLIGPDWLSHRSGGVLKQQSLRRKEDWVRQEVELGLQVEGRTLPVLIGPAVMPWRRRSR